MRITLAVKDGDRTFFVVGIRVGRIKGGGRCGIGGVEVNLLGSRGGGLRGHQRGRDIDRLWVRTGLNR